MTLDAARDRSRRSDELTAPAVGDLEKQVGQEKDRPQTRPKAGYLAEGRGTVRRAILELQRSAGNRAVEYIAGAPLYSGLRADMEKRLGADLSHVRVHADERAASEAISEDAAAFARGADVTFSPGMYEPGSEAGRVVLAHELAHVVQQTRTVAQPLGSPAELEREADRAAVDGGAIIGRAPEGALQRVAAPLDKEVRDRIDRLRQRYAKDAEDPAFEKGMKDLERLGRKDPEAALGRIDEVEAQAKARNVESAFWDASRWATRDEKALTHEPGEEPAEALSVREKKAPRLGVSRSASADAEAVRSGIGDPRPAEHDTHHIVANKEPRAAVARKILLDEGINPRTDPENTLHLPRTSTDPQTIPEAATRHQTVHTNGYYQRLTLRLIEAKKNGTVRETLATIQRELAEGKFNAARIGPSRQKFADWLLGHEVDLDWMTSEEFDEVLEGLARTPRKAASGSTSGQKSPATSTSGTPARKTIGTGGVRKQPYSRGWLKDTPPKRPLGGAAGGKQARTVPVATESNPFAWERIAEVAGPESTDLATKPGPVGKRIRVGGAAGGAIVGGGSGKAPESLAPSGEPFQGTKQGPAKTNIGKTSAKPVAPMRINLAPRPSGPTAQSPSRLSQALREAPNVATVLADLQARYLERKEFTEDWNKFWHGTWEGQSVRIAEGGPSDELFYAASDYAPIIGDRGGLGYPVDGLLFLNKAAAGKLASGSDVERRQLADTLADLQYRGWDTGAEGSDENRFRPRLTSDRRGPLSDDAFVKLLTDIGLAPQSQ